MYNDIYYLFVRMVSYEYSLQRRARKAVKGINLDVRYIGATYFKGTCEKI